MRTLSLSLLAICACANAQITFQTVYNGPSGMYDAGHKVIQLADGGYAVAGITSGGNIFDALLLRFNADGSMVWDKTYDLGHFEFVTDLLAMPDGGYLLGGTVAYANDQNGVLLIRTDAQGDTLWTRRWLADLGTGHWAGMTRLTDGNIVVATHVIGSDGTTPNMAVVRFDQAGNVTGTHVNTAFNGGSGRDVAQLTGGTVVIAGQQGAMPNDSTDAAFWLYDQNLSAIGMFLYGNDGTPDLTSDAAFAIEATPDGGFVTTGLTTEPVTGDTNVFVMKVAPLWDFTWTLVIGGTSPYIGRDVVRCADGNFHVLWTAGTGPTATVHISTVGPGGNLLGTLDIGAPNDYLSAQSITATTDGSPVMTGLLATGGFGQSQRDLHLTKVTGNCQFPSAVINGTDEVSNLLAWPSPFMGHLTITVPQWLDQATVTIIDLLGHELRTLNTVTSNRITWDGRTTSGTEVPPGMYLVTVIADGERYTQRVIKQ